MPHTNPGVDIRDSGSFMGRAQIIDFDANLTATVANGVADVDGSAGGGSGFEIQDEGATVQTGVTVLDTVDGVYVDSFGTGFAAISAYGSRRQVLAGRPAAGRKNKMGAFYATDTKTLYFSDGTTWNTISVIDTMAAQAASGVAITGGSITGITDLAVADGGTGASTAAGARTNLDAAQTSHAHAASDITSGTVATARLGSGTADNTTFLRGDQTYAVPSGGGGVTDAKAIAYAIALG